MNILKPTTEPQQLLFIPRYEVATVFVKLLNEFTEDLTLLELNATYDNGYMTVEINHSFKEGENYSYEVEDGLNNLLYRGKIYITSQTDLQNFKLTI